jgi:hypothetical protein
MRIAPAFVILLLAARITAAAEEGCPLPAHVGIGARVRGRVPGREYASVTGQIVECNGEALILSTGDSKTLTTLPHRSIKKLSLSTGEKRATNAGALVGGILLGLVVATGGATLASNCDDNCDGADDASRRTLMGGLKGLMVGGVVGTVLGAGVGSAIAEERWERVDHRAPRAHAALGGRRRPLALALTVRF